MVTKTKILKVLKYLEKIYLDPKTNSDLRDYCAKLALLELCGWIEKSMDDIVLIKRKSLKNAINVKYLEKVIIQKNSSMNYDGFRRMLIGAIGLINVEVLEKNIGSSNKQILESKLGTLKNMRDDHAHTYCKGGTHKFYAPSVLISDFLDIYKILIIFEENMKK